MLIGRDIWNQHFVSPELRCLFFQRRGSGSPVGSDRALLVFMGRNFRARKELE